MTMDESRTHDYGDPNQPCYKSPESSSSYSIRTEDSMRQTEGDLEPAKLAGHEKDTLRAARREALQPTRRAFSFDGGQVRDEYFFSEPRPYHEPEESIRRACSFEYGLSRPASVLRLTAGGEPEESYRRACSFETGRTGLTGFTGLSRPASVMRLIAKDSRADSPLPQLASKPSECWQEYGFPRKLALLSTFNPTTPS
jgi:hypothetical protein